MKNKFKEIILEHFFRPKFWSIIINPYFIARYNLFKRIKAFSKNYNWSNKEILDVGCGIKPYSILFKNSKYLGIDVEDSGHKNEFKYADVYFDGKNIPFSDKSFDLVICTQVIEHSLDYQFLLKEIYRVLKDNGLLLLTTPFVWNEHEIPYDFFRFTQYAHKAVLNDLGFDILKLEPTTKFFATIGQLISAFIFETIGKYNLFLKLFTSIVFCFPIQLMFILLDFILPSKWLTLDYLVIAKKPVKI